MKNPFLTGKQIYLAPLAKDDISEAYVRWLNDDEICRYNSHATFPNTTSRTVQYIEAMNSCDNQFVFTIRCIENELHIGNIALQDVNWINRSGEISIVIGEKEYWGKGVATEAYRLLIDYGFKRLNLHRLHSGMAKANLGMIKVCEKLGMTREAEFREAFYKNGNYYNIVLYSLLRTDL